MKTLSREITGIFFIDNHYINDTLKKEIHYDDTKKNAYENAYSALLKCIPTAKYLLHNDKIAFTFAPKKQCRQTTSNRKKCFPF